MQEQSSRKKKLLILLNFGLCYLVKRVIDVLILTMVIALLLFEMKFDFTILARLFS